MCKETLFYISEKVMVLNSVPRNQMTYQNSTPHQITFTWQPYRPTSMDKSTHRFRIYRLDGDASQKNHRNWAPARILPNLNISLESENSLIRKGNNSTEDVYLQIIVEVSTSLRLSHRQRTENCGKKII